MNLFLTEDGVLKLGYYGLITQAECYSIRKKDCDGIRSFAPEVFEGKYEMKSDVWSFGTALLELMGKKPYYWHDDDRPPRTNALFESPFKPNDINSSQLVRFLKKCFEKKVCNRRSVNELMNVSVMGWRMMSSIHL